MPRGPGTGAGQGHQGSVSLGRGRVQDAEAETQSRPLGVYGPAASEHSKCRAEGNVDAESVPRRGSGKTARRRGLCHDSHRPAGRGQEERVRVCATVGDEVAWKAAPVPGSAPSPKSHLHLGPSPTPPSSPAACSVPPSLKSLTHRLLHPPPGHADHVCCRHLLASDSPLSPHDLPAAGKSCFLSSHQ